MSSKHVCSLFGHVCHEALFKVFRADPDVAAISAIRVYAIDGRKIIVAMTVLSLCLVPLGTNIVRTNHVNETRD